ncbi:MAG TPA: Maf family protein [Lacipirellulaceae bacterium]|nr:Maf family protein [Lacipirellulaceae bacterium]
MIASSIFAIEERRHNRMTKAQFPAPSPRHHLILASGSPRRRELLQEAGYAFTIMPPKEEVECGVCSESGPGGLVAELAYRKAAAVRNKLKTESLPLPLSRSPLLILAADTVVECDGFILGKPRDEQDARNMLAQLSSREHRVLTGVCLWPVEHPLSPPRDSGEGAFPPLAPGAGQGEGALLPSPKRLIPAQLLKNAREFERQDTFTPSPSPEGKDEPLIRVAVTKLRMDPLNQEQFDDYIASGQWEGKAGAFGYQDRLGWVHIVEGSETNVVGLPMELLAEMLAEVARSRGQEAGRSE